MNRASASKDHSPETSSDVAAVLDALARALAPHVARLVVAQLRAPTHYTNGRSPMLPAGWTCDRFLRWCRDRQRDGGVRVERDGKLRRVRREDLDTWLSAHHAVTAAPPATANDVDDEAALELGLRATRRAR